VTTPHCVQINLQQGFGGGEVYTQFVCRALVELGWRVDLLVSENATAWHGFALPGLQLRPIGASDTITSRLPAATWWLYAYAAARTSSGQLRQLHPTVWCFPVCH
jgi:hypothetical protein